jgi:hypothetical protein
MFHKSFSAFIPKYDAKRGYYWGKFSGSENVERAIMKSVTINVWNREERESTFIRRQMRSIISRMVDQ